MEEEFKHSISVWYKEWSSRKKVICSCGHSYSVNRWSGEQACSSCGNTRTFEITKRNINIQTSTIDGLLECIAKDDRSFHIKKTEIKGTIDFNSNKLTVAKGNHVYEFKFSLKDKSMEFFKNSTKQEANERNIDIFFRGIGTEEFLTIASTESSYDILKFATQKLSRLNDERSNKIGRALKRLFQYPKLETFAFSGCNYIALSQIFGDNKIMCSQETQPHKILGVPKYMVPIMREANRFGRYDIQHLQELDEKLNGNNVILMAQILREENDIANLFRIDEYLLELYDKYNYKDIKRLMLYCCREVKLQQGIDNPYSALQYLRDYARMSVDIGARYDRYPTSLKKDHDIVQMNYKVKSDEIKNRKFKEEVDKEEYKSLTYKGKEFSIIAPQEGNDLVVEGSSLSHCVSSYVSDVANGKCKVLFLRANKMLDNPLVTIDVRGSNIRQVKGEFNRKPTNEEVAFVAEWAKEMELTYDSW